MIAAATLVEALSRELPGDRLVVDPDVLAAISHDEAEWAPAGTAVAGVRARTEAEVQHVVRTCAELGAPVVPRGAGSAPAYPAEAVRAFRDALDVLVTVQPVPGADHAAAIMTMTGARATAGLIATALAPETLA